MSLLAGVLSACALLLPVALPGLAFVGAGPLPLAALPWLALAPLASRPTAHLALGLPVLGLGVGLELAAGGAPAGLAVRVLAVLLWGVLFASGPRGPRAWSGLALATTAALLFLTPATAPGQATGAALTFLARVHPLAVTRAWAAAGPAGAVPDLLTLAGATGFVVVLALLVRAGGRSAGEGAGGPGEEPA